ncbi:Hypothetical protein PHPALM_4024 [Phytophthora palmivora]|uniref:Integrase catalytic domain-containing protein n=1 Tax=Phytophthora palmivora TaxID=4796 RepID=A0A2P4YKW4_9STRA|nr:Hypothetical protein PHPALM_4024 [Phytophthora palmivora]
MRPINTPDSTVTVEALLAWHSRFGVPPTWISDQGSHFKNEVVCEMSRRVRTQREFTPTFCPWINDLVERVNRDILQVVQTMILEYKIHYKDWVYLVPMVQSSFNHTMVPSLGNRAPAQLFIGLPCPTTLREFYVPEAQDLREVPASADIDMFLANLRSSIQDIHKQRLLNKKRERGENVVNFSEHDFVLRSIVDEKSGNKLLVTWVGPYRVVRADAHSFRIQHLITGAELLKFYAASNLNVTEEPLEHISSQGVILAVKKLKGHRWNSKINDYEVLAKWKGLESIEDSYEPPSSLARDIETLVKQYVATADQQLQEYWQQVTMGGEQQQQEHVASTPLLEKKTRSKKPNRSCQQQRQPAVNQDVPDHSPDNVQASNRGELAALCSRR